jgi:YD repeat-containing protein
MATKDGFMTQLRNIVLGLVFLVFVVLLPMTAHAQCLSMTPGSVSVTATPQQVVGASTQVINITVNFVIAECTFSSITLASSIPVNDVAASVPGNANAFGLFIASFCVDSPNVSIHECLMYPPGNYSVQFQAYPPPVTQNTPVTFTATVYGSTSTSATVTIVPLTMSLSLSNSDVAAGSAITVYETFNAPPVTDPTAISVSNFGLQSTPGWYMSWSLTGSPSSFGVTNTAPSATPSPTTYQVSMFAPVTQQAMQETITQNIAYTVYSASATPATVNLASSVLLTIEPQFPYLPSETAPGPQCPACGSPISIASGNTYITENDFTIPGLGGGLTLSRTWNSMWPASQSTTEQGMFGDRWRSNYEERVFPGSDGTVKYSRADGSFWSFSLSGNGYQLIAPANGGAVLTSGTGYWTVTYKSGETRLFNNTSGSLMAILDRNGNQTLLSYDVSNRLTTVTDPASRHLYFSYPNSSSYLVTSVTSDVGVSLSYAYDTQNRLILVTEPDNSTVSFVYNDPNPYLITAVLDSAGKILESHTYDSKSRGLTSSHANGVATVTLSYSN